MVIQHQVFSTCKSLPFIFPSFFLPLTTWLLGCFLLDIVHVDFPFSIFTNQMLPSPKCFHFYCDHQLLILFVFLSQQAHMFLSGVGRVWLIHYVNESMMLCVSLWLCHHSWKWLCKAHVLFAQVSSSVLLQRESLSEVCSFLQFLHLQLKLVCT